MVCNLSAAGAYSGDRRRPSVPVYSSVFCISCNTAGPGLGGRRQRQSRQPAPRSMRYLGSRYSHRIRPGNPRKCLESLEFRWQAAYRNRSYLRRSNTCQCHRCRGLSPLGQCYYPYPELVRHSLFDHPFLKQ